jgi:steroid delta-isomerase-like uncharacterized protein
MNVVRPSEDLASTTTQGGIMPAQATAVSPQALIDAAKAPILAFNDKNWDRVRASITPDFVYDEVASGRKPQGADAVIPVWQGWAQAFPDSKATFNNALVSGNSVVLEVTWKGTHQGPLQTPKGAIAATNKPIEIRACFIVELAGERARLQRHYFDMATLFEQIGVKV